MASPFATEIAEIIGYSNLYYRDVEEIGSRAKSRKLGWHNGSDEDKGELFENMCIDMEEDRFYPRSVDLIRECGEYEWDKGKIVHRPTKDAGVAGQAHGDRCVGAGVARLLCRDRPLNGIDEREEDAQDYPYGSFGWRQQREEEENREWTDEDPQFTLRDLLRRS